MTAIPTTFGSGGANLAPGGAQGTPDLATTLRDIADDLATLKGATQSTSDAGTTAQADAVAVAGADLTAIATADLNAFTDPPSAAELALLRSLVNELKAKYNTAVPLVNEVKASANGAIALANALKTVGNAASTLATALKTRINAVVSTTLKTSKA